MRSGRLNKRIRFEESTEAQDGSGAIVTDWVHVVTVWGELLPTQIRTDEGTESASEFAAAMFDITIRYRTEIDHSMFVVIDAKRYQLVSHPVDPDGKRKELFMRAKIV